jgi:hypothetical protein
LLDTTCELLYFSSAFRLAFLLAQAAFRKFHFGFQTRHLLADRFQLSAVTAKGSKNSSTDLIGFRGAVVGLTGAKPPFEVEARLKCVFKLFPKWDREMRFSHNGTVSPLLSRLYQQFVLTLKSEMLYVWPRSYGLALCPQ